MNVPTPTLAADWRYIASQFTPLAALLVSRLETTDIVNSWISSGLFPHPTYLMPESPFFGADTPMYPADVFDFVDQAGSIEMLPQHFEQRLVAADPANCFDAKAEYRSYLSGRYGACLKRVTPESIVQKERLVQSIDAALTEPRAFDVNWLSNLRRDVDALDLLERPFAECDRSFFGGSVSRDRCITEPRKRYLQSA